MVQKNSYQHTQEFYDNYKNNVYAAAGFLTLEKRNLKPEFAIVLGSGLGDLADSIETKIEIPYENIPHFPTTSVEGHEGKLIFGDLSGVPVIGMKGRTHYHEVALEGPQAILKSVFGVHVMAELGVQNYFVTNAAGALNLDYEVGDTMIIDSHIHSTGIPNPTSGNHDFKKMDGQNTVDYFQPMKSAYDKGLREMLRKAAPQKERMKNGVYMAVPGPTYETEAEARAYKNMGADVVGMSTTPEVIVARNRGMNVVGMSCVTNIVDPDSLKDANHDEVKRVLESKETRTRLADTVKNFFDSYANSK